MNTQSTQTLSLSPGEARRVGHGRAGELTVLSGRVWLTADGDEDDSVLAAGQSRRFGDPHAVVVEAWDRGQGAVVRWTPRRQAQGLRLRAWLGGFFAALARNAASSANRAHGSISCGDSIASSGALK